MKTKSRMFFLGCAGLLVLLISTGCSKPAMSDQQLQTTILQALVADPALAGQQVQVEVRSKVASISGTVASQDQIQAAIRDASIPGIVQVVNQVSVNQAVATIPPQPVSVAPPQPQPRRYTSPQPRPYQAQTVPQPVPQPAPIPQSVAPPPPPPPPVVTTITLPVGTVIPIRVTESLSSANAQPNQVFHGSVAVDIPVGGMIAVPQGTSVVGRVVDAKDAAHFAGSSLLSIELTQIDFHGSPVSIITDTFTEQGKARGTNTAEKVGGGALGGGILGGLLGGKKGVAAGAGIGGGAGAVDNAVTRGQQVQIPSETLVNFTLQSPISVPSSRTR